MARLHTLNIEPRAVDGRKRFFVIGEDGNSVSQGYVQFEDASDERSRLIDVAVRDWIASVRTKYSSGMEAEQPSLFSSRVDKS